MYDFNEEIKTNLLYFIDFSNIKLNDNISIYLIDKKIINENELSYYPLNKFKNHYKFTNEIKLKIINLINHIISNLNNYIQKEIIDDVKQSIIEIICDTNPTCFCPIIYKYKLNLNHKLLNQNNIIKKIINAGKSQEEFNKSLELRLQIQEDLINSIEMRLNSLNINKKNKFIILFFSIIIILNIFIFIEYKKWIN